MGAVMEKMLMPAEGSYTQDFTGFPEPTPDSMLLIAEVHFAATKLDAVKSFFLKGLGAREAGATFHAYNDQAGDAATKRCCFSAGPSKLTVSEHGETSESWPGQFYVWVQNIQETWQACQALETELGQKVIDQAICNADERKADALVLKVPSSETVVVVNQAPKGYASKLYPQGASGNLLCVVDVEICVPPGTADNLLTFYRQTLISAVKKTDQGKFMVMFASGDYMRQSLSFREDAAAASKVSGLTLTVQMASRPKFTLVTSKLRKAGLLSEAAAADAEEVQFQELVDPESGSVLLGLQQVIRAPQQTDPLLAGA